MKLTQYQRVSFSMMVLVACASCTPVSAPIQSSNVGATEASGVGEWLSLQASGERASVHLQQATAREKELANQRLLDSYELPIPEYFPRSPGGEAP